MTTDETLNPIPGRLHSVASEHHVAGADEIFDDEKGMLQSTINGEQDVINSKKANKSDALHSIKISSGSALSTSGWCRVAEIKPENLYYGSFFIHIITRHMHLGPSPILLLLSCNSGRHYLSQIGKRPSSSTSFDIQKVRVVQSGSGANSKIYLDVYNYVPTSGGNTVCTYIIPLMGEDYNLTVHTYEDVNNEATGANYTEIVPETA